MERNAHIRRHTQLSRATRSNQQAAENPRFDPLWALALDNLEAQFPQLLEELLNQGQLAAYLDELIDHTLETQWNLLVKNPGLTEAELDRLGAEVWAPRNPNYDPCHPQQMTAEAKRKLAEFRDKHGLGPSRRQPVSGG